MDITQLQDQLRDRAFLHDDPEAYLAGVHDAVTVIAEDVTVTDEKADTA